MAARIMKPSIIVLGGLLLLMPIVAEARPLELIGVDFPELADGLSETSGKGCAPAHARKPAAVTGVWAGRITAITLTCEPMPGIDNEADASTLSIATLKPGAATFGGVPVIEVRLSQSWAHFDNQYVLDGRFETVGPELIKKIQAQCRKKLGAVDTAAACPAERDGEHGGYFIGSEGGGLWLHPDEANPNRTIYADAWSE